MPRSRKCSVCERRVNKSQKHVVDIDTGRRFHVKCYVANYGDLPKNVKTVSENSIRENPTRQDLVDGIKDEKEGAAKYKQWADEYYQKGDYASAELMKEFANDELGHKAGLKGLAMTKNPTLRQQYFNIIRDAILKTPRGIMTERQMNALKRRYVNTTEFDNALKILLKDRDMQKEGNLWCWNYDPSTDTFRWGFENVETKPVVSDAAKGLAKDVGGMAAATKMGKRSIRGAVEVLRHLPSVDPLAIPASSVLLASKLKGRKGIAGKVGRIASIGERPARVYSDISKKVARTVTPVAAGFIPVAGGILSPILAEGLKDSENPKIIAQEFENILAMKDHGDIMLMRGNEGVYRWDANLGAWTPEEKFLTEYSGFNPSPVRSQFALQEQTGAEIENPMKYAEGSYEKLPYGKYIRERQIDPDVFDPRSFRTRKTKSGHALIFGCPAGQWDAKNAKCRVATKLQSILHPMREASEKRFAKMWKSPKSENITEEQKQHVKKFASALGKMKNPIKRNAYFHKLRDHMQQSALHYQMGDKNNAAKHYFQGFGLWQGLTKPEIARFGREAPVEFDWYNKGYMMFGGAENPKSEREVAAGMQKKGYRYIILVPGKDAVYAKTMKEATTMFQELDVAGLVGTDIEKYLASPDQFELSVGNPENAVDVKALTDAGKSIWKFLNTPEGKKIAAAAAKAGKDVFEMAAKAMSKTTAKVSNPEMNLIIGNKIKKALGVMRVIKRYHNKHRDGSGNFGYTIVAPSTKAFMGKYEEWFTLDGSYDSAGNSHRLTFATFSGSNRISIPEAATYDQLVASMKSFITEMTGAENVAMNKSDYVFQLCVYHGYKRADLQGKTVKQLKEMLNKYLKNEENPAKSAVCPHCGKMCPYKYRQARYWCEPCKKWFGKEENPETAHLKHFSDPDTGKDWAETNKVDVLDIYYSPEVGQYVVKYRGFPVVDEKHTSDAVVTEENPSSMPKAMHVAKMLMESEE